MGACASFPKGVKKEALETPLPEQPKEVNPTADVAADVAEAEKEIKSEGKEKKQEGGGDNKAKEEEEKAIDSSIKQGETEVTKTTVTEEEITLETKETEKDSPEIIEVKLATTDDNKETTEVKDEK